MVLDGFLGYKFTSYTGRSSRRFSRKAAVWQPLNRRKTIVGKGAVSQPSKGGHNQGLPARSSMKTGHWPVFRALRTPFREPPRLCLSSLRESRVYRPVLAENRPLACFPGAANPGRQRRKERILCSRSAGSASQKFILAPHMSLLRI